MRREKTETEQRKLKLSNAFKSNRLVLALLNKLPIIVQAYLKRKHWSIAMKQCSWDGNFLHANILGLFFFGGGRKVTAKEMAKEKTAPLPRLKTK